MFAIILCGLPLICIKITEAFAEATKLPQYTAVKHWQDTVAEIKLKKALEKMMVGRKIPALLIRSVNLKQISALNDLGLKLPGDAEIDLVMAFLSDGFLHVRVFEVKRRDTFPWQTQSRPPNKQGVDKAENQLTKDIEILNALLAGIPPDQIVFHTLACYPDSAIAELQTHSPLNASRSRGSATLIAKCDSSAHRPALAQFLGPAPLEVGSVHECPSHREAPERPESTAHHARRQAESVEMSESVR